LFKRQTVVVPIEHNDAQDSADDDSYDASAPSYKHAIDDPTTS
jgi:hypothetical protein